jgi:hypothetical protein
VCVHAHSPGIFTTLGSTPHPTVRRMTQMSSHWIVYVRVCCASQPRARVLVRSVTLSLSLTHRYRCNHSHLHYSSTQRGEHSFGQVSLRFNVIALCRRRRWGNFAPRVFMSSTFFKCVIDTKFLITALHSGR